MSKDRRNIVYAGKVVDVRRESVRLPNGVELDLEVVEHPGGAAVVAVDAKDRLCLVHQYRHVAGGYVWELPAGKIDAGEPPILTAQRELADEAGIEAKLWVSLGSILSSPGVFDEVIHLWLAAQLVATEPGTDDDEVLEVHWVDFDVALDWAVRGKIRDGKTLAGLLRAGRLRGQDDR